jgi:uncharacterized YigZ family protein
MKSIKAVSQFEWIIQKSRFIGLLVPVKNMEEINAFLQQARLDFPNANHVCFAYILSSLMVAEKASDDGEPQKTAGMPILEVLKKNDLTDCLGIVIRFFGGIKLGAGGLIRAYAKTMRSCIEKADFAFPKSFDECVLELDYSQAGPIEPLLRSLAEVTSHHFTETATFHFLCESEKTKMITEEIKKRTSSDVAVKIIRSLIKFQ